MKKTLDKEVIEQSSVEEPKPLLMRNDAPHAPKNRPARKSLQRVGNLRFPKLDGFHTRVVTLDDPNQPERFQQFKDAWWEPVTRADMYGADCENPGEYVRVNTGKSDGIVTHGIVMKLPDELRAEDEKAKEELRENKVRSRANDGEQGTSLKLNYGQ